MLTEINLQMAIAIQQWLSNTAKVRHVVYWAFDFRYYQSHDTPSKKNCMNIWWEGVKVSILHM